MPNGKPNILVIWGDDIGWFNPSCYHRGMMGYRTPNIDRIANEGAVTGGGVQRMGVQLGGLDDDPGVRPGAHAYVAD